MPALRELCEQHGVGAVLPLTDLDIEVLARRARAGTLPALVPAARSPRATYDKYETHLLLQRARPALAADRAARARTSTRSNTRSWSSRAAARARARSTSPATPAQARFFIDYVEEPTMVQRAMDGPELSIDCLGDLDGRCLNAIPRTMLESRGGESIKGAGGRTTRS